LRLLASSAPYLGNNIGPIVTTETNGKSYPSNYVIVGDLE